MKEIKSYDKLVKIAGGLNISGLLLNSISNGIKTVFELGQKIGTSIRRIKNKTLCKI